MVAPGSAELLRKIFNETAAAQHVRTSALFLRLLGFIHLAAFVSFGSQALGLIGSGGILPLGEYVITLRDELGTAAWRDVPFLFWLDSSDLAIRAVVVLGILASIALVAGRLRRVALVVLYVSYLSLLYAGQSFMTFQWDILLVETTALALFIPGHPMLGVW